MFLYTLGALMNFGGFISPLRRAGRWLEHAPGSVKVAIFFLVVATLAYPSFIHKLWADATAQEVRRSFAGLAPFPGAQAATPTEQMNGLYDPTTADGSYIIGWYGTSAGFSEIQAHYERTLADQGWVRQPEQRETARLIDGPGRLVFRDHTTPARANYELVLLRLSPGTREAPAEIATAPTVFAVRLGVIDPRATTQVAWFIDCLVRRAPTFPSCEAMGWHPLEAALDRSAPVPPGFERRR